MTYKEELLREIEDAKIWVHSSLLDEEKLMEKKTDTESILLVRTSMIDPRLIEECTFVDKLEEHVLDAWVSSQVIGCRKEKQLFNDMLLTDGSPAQLEESITRMWQRVKDMQKYTTVDDNIRIPLRPRDHLYQTLANIEVVGYNENTLDSVFELVQRSGRRPQGTRLTKEYGKKLMKWVDEIDNHRKEEKR